MNALVKANNRTAAAYGNGDPYAAAANALGGSDAKYLKFNGNSGEYTHGKEQDELPHGSKLAVNMAQFRRGWICWKEGNVVQEIMVPVSEGLPPSQSDLPDHGPYVVTAEQKDGWSEQAAIDLRDITTGAEYTLKVTSKSGLRGLGTLLKDFIKAYKAHPDELPVVELGSSTFMPKQKSFGKKHAPKLTIVEWVNEAELLGRFGDDAGGYEEDEGAGEGEVEGGEEATVEATPEAPPPPKPTAASLGKAAGGPRVRKF